MRFTNAVIWNSHICIFFWMSWGFRSTLLVKSGRGEEETRQRRRVRRRKQWRSDESEMRQRRKQWNNTPSKCIAKPIKNESNMESESHWISMQLLGAMETREWRAMQLRTFENAELPNQRKRRTDMSANREWTKLLSA